MLHQYEGARLYVSQSSLPLASIHAGTGFIDGLLMERAAFSYSLTGVVESMSNPMYDEYERLVVVADHLQHRIDSYGQEIEDLLNLVYRGSDAGRDVSAASSFAVGESDACPLH